MLGLFESIILGIIQGLTEFLPVSSSGHLEIGKYLLGDESIPEDSLMMTVTLHFATALSTIVVFWKDIKTLFLGVFRNDKSSVNFTLNILISTIPAVAIGLIYEEKIESLFNDRLDLVSIMLILTGVLLFISDIVQKKQLQVGPVDSIYLGIAQAIAILPGISRSGATISTAILLGIDKEKAARFSFLMVIPIIFGKMGKDILSIDFSDKMMIEGADWFFPLLLGFISAFITGMLACKWMISLVKHSKLKYFSFYCISIGAIIYLLVKL